MRKKAHIGDSRRERPRMRVTKEIKKYGEDNFIFKVIEDNVETDDLNRREMYNIKKYDTFLNGYNDTIGGGYTYRRWETFNNFKKIVDDVKKGVIEDESNPRIKMIQEACNLLEDVPKSKDKGKKYWEFIRDVNSNLDGYVYSEDEIMFFDTISYNLNKTLKSVKEISKELGECRMKIGDVKNGVTYVNMWDGDNRRFIEEFGKKIRTDIEYNNVLNVYNEFSGIFSYREIEYICGVKTGNVSRLVLGRKNIDGWEKLSKDARRKGHSKGGQPKYDYSEVVTLINTTKKGNKEISGITGIPATNVGGVRRGEVKYLEEKLKHKNLNKGDEIKWEKALEYLEINNGYKELTQITKDVYGDNFDKEKVRNFLLLKRNRKNWFKYDVEFYEKYELNVRVRSEMEFELVKK